MVGLQQPSGAGQRDRPGSGIHPAQADTVRGAQQPVGGVGVGAELIGDLCGGYRVVTQGVGTLFPADPPRFLARTPHGYHRPDVIAADLAQGGFVRPPQIVTLTARSHAAGPAIPAIAFCQGTPLRTEIETRGPGRLLEATGIAEAAVAARFGTGPIDGKMQALIVGVER